jgi:hypothetical protein
MTDLGQIELASDINVLNSRILTETSNQVVKQVI